MIYEIEDEPTQPGHRCDCGAVKAKTTHAGWCSTMSEVVEDTALSSNDVKRLIELVDEALIPLGS